MCGDLTGLTARLAKDMMRDVRHKSDISDPSASAQTQTHFQLHTQTEMPIQKNHIKVLMVYRI